MEETKTGGPLALPIVRQLAAILERRLAGRDRFPEQCRVRAFPSETSESGRIAALQHLNGRIGEAGGARFWFHALRNCFITVADREPMLPTSLTKRLANHARPSDVTEGYPLPPPRRTARGDGDVYRSSATAISCSLVGMRGLF